jgi:hypothetical protein
MVGGMGGQQISAGQLAELAPHCGIGADAFCWLDHAEHGDTVNAFLITLGIVAALTLSYVVIMVEMLVVVTGHSWLAGIIVGVLLLVFLLFKRNSA